MPGRPPRRRDGGENLLLVLGPLGGAVRLVERGEHLAHPLAAAKVAGASSMLSRMNRLRSPTFFSAFALPSRASAAFAVGAEAGRRARIAVYSVSVLG